MASGYVPCRCHSELFRRVPMFRFICSRLVEPANEPDSFARIETGPRNDRGRENNEQVAGDRTERWVEEEAEVRCFLTSRSVAAQCHYTCADAHVKTCVRPIYSPILPEACDTRPFTGKLNITDSRCLGVYCRALKSAAREGLARNRISFVPCWPSYASGEYGEQGNMVMREACPRTGVSDRYSLRFSRSLSFSSLLLFRCDRFTKTSSFSERPLSD